ncbi:hypothetical protein CRE_21181 [Caenorhabditis remanei]|uniref:Uncharacterized protein n=1 Tax=Caenorhabditis remanei TaxID=31234 RepID=E3MF72_CAERE|nr:hypothetical protein CRE_21181 [Caenorhabditis remanei]
MTEPSTQTFHLWNQLPPEIKVVVMEKMDGIDKLKIRQCSKTEKELVDKLPIITIQQLKFKFDENGRTMMGVEQLKLKDTEVSLLNIFSNPKIIVKNFDFFRTLNYTNCVYNELNKLSEAASARNIRLRAECVHFTFFEAFPESASKTLQIFDESCIKSIKILAPTEETVAAISQTAQWKGCQEVVICDQKGIRFVADSCSYKMTNFLHFQRVNLMIKMLTVNEACILIKNMQSKARGHFKIITSLNIRSEAIFRSFQPEIIKKQKILDGELYQLSMTDPNLILCVETSIFSMKGVICRRERILEDFAAGNKILDDSEVIQEEE